MNRRLIALLTFALAVIASQAQQLRRESPKGVVEEYWRLGEAGTLLTQDGWAKANVIFAQSSPIDGDKNIAVVSKHYSVEEISMNGRSAEVDVLYEDLGIVDQKLVYRPPHLTHFFDTAVRYQLTLSTGPGGEQQWRIVRNKPVRWAGVDSVITHLRAAQKNSTDPINKRNATRSIEALTRYR